MKRWTALAVLLLAMGCGGDDDAWWRAVAIERQILASTPTASYSDARYLHVMRELRRVPAGSPHRGQADRLFARISDARRIAAVQAHPGVTSVPSRLQGASPPAPARVTPARPARSAAPPQGGFELSEADRSKLDITLFSAVWCGYCKKARSWFHAQGIPFQELDIEKDPGAREQYVAAARGYQGVPLIVVNGTAIRGFDRPKVERAIRAALDG